MFVSACDIVRELLTGINVCVHANIYELLVFVFVLVLITLMILTVVSIRILVFVSKYLHTY